jgi:hypothetical protein
MNEMTTSSELLAGIGAGIIALIFARSTVHKLADFPYFVATLRDYRLLPPALLSAVASSLTLSEASSVVLLILPTTRATGALSALALLALYALAMAANLQRGRTRIDCGCGGPGQAISWMLVARNAVLVGVCGYVAMFSAGTRLDLRGTAVVFGGILAGWVLMLVCDQVIGNRTHAQATIHSGLRG